MIATRLTYLLLALAAVLLGLSQFYPLLKNFGLVLDIVLAIFVVIDYQLTIRPSFIIGSRELSDRLSIGRENSITLKILNQGAQPISCLVKDDYPRNLEADVALFAFRLPALGESTLTYSVRPKRRGAYQFGDINLRYKSRLGLFWRQVKLPAARTIKVYSDLKALYDLSIRLSRSSELGELHQRKRGQGTDFSSLREYTVGDDAKLIDWKATARRDRPVVRTYEAEQEQRLLILIDAGRMMVSDLEGLTRFDHALNAALCLALTDLTHNDQVGLGIFADKPLLYLPARRGKGYLKNMLDGCFDVEPRLVEPDYLGMLSYFAAAQKGRSLIVVLTDLTDPVGSQSLLSGLAGLSPRHLPFCVTLTDRQVIAVANSHLPSSQSDKEIASIELEPLYRRAVAIDLLAQREVALSVLQRRGCLILDCPPQELSDKIVDQYLEIKTRARL
ncbi:MAG TPA: DUF58 domain-containing protein [Chroococcales cyanobacterium]